MSDLPEQLAHAAGSREREYQDPHYHDEEPEIQNDELPRHAAPALGKLVRFPKPRRRFEDD